MEKNQRISFELLSHNEIDKFQEFIRDHYRNNHLFANETSVFDWQHKGSQSYHCMIAKEGEVIVGVQGVIPLSHFDNNLPKTQIFLALWRAIENHDVGIGLRLYMACINEYSPEFTASIGINDRAIPFHKWQDFTVTLMDHHVALSPYVESYKIAKLPETLRTRTPNIRSTISFQKLNKRQLQDLDTQKLYLHQLPLKSNTYIINRFLEHPVYSYDVYAFFKEDEILGLGVVRPIQINDVVVLRFVDFIGPNNIFPLLDGFVLDLLKKHQAEYLDIYSYGVPSSLIQKAGFINRKNTKDLIIPNYFEPFKQKNIDINIAFKCSKSHPSVRLFKGDGDYDRPSVII